MNVDFLGGAAIGASPLVLWKVISWFATRDRARVEDDTRELWCELERVKAEQSDLKAKVAALPLRGDIQRLEERLEKRLNDLTSLILDALKR